ncbi:hypothetical protein GBK04_11135 [Cytophagaceae bacterium SJW1-29]|uniref:DNA-binding protein n=1 Tax=Salmonirosea aquatica TaxID=2654236 RepID=A0A7C9FZ67_9BACT|nr:hypothetical protein [Cytophagaceae bacterium SJW1-29]
MSKLLSPLLASPAKRALNSHGISTLQQLAEYSEAEIQHFHGVGPGTLLKLRSALKNAGLTFKN